MKSSMGISICRIPTVFDWAGGGSEQYFAMCPGRLHLKHICERLFDRKFGANPGFLGGWLGFRGEGRLGTKGRYWGVKGLGGGPLTKCGGIAGRKLFRKLL